MRDQTEYNVRAVERAIQILECFDDAHPERGISEISEEIGLHKATTHRILTTLLNFGYIERASDGLRYRLGLKLSDLGYKVIRRMDLRREALPLMTQLTQRLDEGSDLSVFDRGQVFYVEVVPSSHALTVAAVPGQRLPPHCTASGKLFLAHLPMDEVKAILSKKFSQYTQRTITSLDQLVAQLELIRQQGFSMDDEEYEIGIRAVSAPIYNQQGTMVAAISVLGPSTRLTLDRCAEIAEELKKTTDAISRRMGRTN